MMITQQPFAIGALVRTTSDDGGSDWSEDARNERTLAVWGSEGYVIDRSDGHGLCYRVHHIELGTKIWYNHGELEEFPFAVV